MQHQLASRSYQVCSKKLLDLASYLQVQSLYQYYLSVSLILPYQQSNKFCYGIVLVYKNLDLILRSVYKDKNNRKKMIEEMAALVEISDVLHSLPSEISGGQAQRAAMARAFLYPSKVLLLDEPFKALDTALKSRLIKKLVELNSIEPRTIVFVTHAIDECLLCADEYFVLEGSPVQVALKGSITSDKKSRALTDRDLEVERNRLLAALAK